MAVMLFNNFRHEEKAVGLGGRIAHGFGMRQRRFDHVRPGDVDEGDGVGGGFDGGDVEFLELGDIVEDAAELGAEGFFLGRGERGRARRATY